MSRTLNEVLLVGNVGRDPDVRATAGGKVVAHLAIATNRLVGSKSGANTAVNEKTDWHRISVFNRLAEYVRDHVKKGDRLLVKGRIEYGSYERGDVTIPTCDIIAAEIIQLTPKEGDADDGEERGE